jgi:WS/DGAT/MGAT family acyltransferase
MALVHPLDAAWLYVESHETPMHVASLQIFSPPPGAPDDYVGQLVADFKKARDIAPPFNRQLAGGVLSALVHAWVDAADVDLDYHVRHSALPRPGGERELGVLVSRLHGHALERHRPLWEAHFIEGLAGGRFAVYMKMHHSLIDGVSGMRLLQRKMTTDAGARGLAPPWGGPSPAAAAEAGAGSVADAPGVVGGGDLLREQLSAVPNVASALLELAGAGLQVEDPLIAPLTCPTAVINGRITAQRRFARQTVRLEEVKALARAADCTVNDIVLAVCAGALRRYLAEAGALPEAPLTAGLPVNVRPADDEGTGTAITFICANLATDVEDPVRRLAGIHASTQRAKEHLQGLPRAALTQYTIAVMAPYILQLLTGLGGRLRPVFNLTISNVTGPEQPLYLNGARLEAMYPMSLLSHGQALNVTCLSYDGALNFGFTGCRDTLPHMQRLAVYAGEAHEELQRAFAPPARRVRRARRPRAAPPAPVKRPAAAPRRSR